MLKTFLDKLTLNTQKFNHSIYMKDQIAYPKLNLMVDFFTCGL